MSTRILLAAGAAVLTFVAACSSKSSDSGGSSPGSASVSAGAPASSGAAAGTVTISLTGSTLTGPDGHTLYANTVDTVAKISCTGECAQEWPPVTGTPNAGSGVDAGKLGTADRPDGTKQVTWDGHPLYEFAEDKAPGDKNGDGVADEGGTWHLATLTTAPASGPASAPSTSDNHGGSSSGTGYNY